MKFKEKVTHPYDARKNGKEEKGDEDVNHIFDFETGPKYHESIS
jgi:hypothetical protein